MRDRIEALLSHSKHSGDQPRLFSLFTVVCVAEHGSYLWGGLAGGEGVPSRTCLDGLGVGRGYHAGCPTLHSRIPMGVGMGVSLASNQASKGGWVGACPS